jgi:hypothetical protein
MSTVTARRDYTDKLLKQLPIGPPARTGDFAAICTDIDRDIWELFPVVMATSTEVISVRSEIGGLLSVDSISERERVVVSGAVEFADLDAVKALCWLPFDGIGALRMHLAKLRVPR